MADEDPGSPMATDESLEETSKSVKTDSIFTPKELRLAIVWDNTKRSSINHEKALLIRKRFDELLDEQIKTEGAFVPRFHSSGLYIGAYKVVCADAESANWVKEVVPKFGELWDGAQLKVVQQQEVDGQHFTLMLPNYEDDDINTLLNRIEKQNAGINTVKWRVNKELIVENKRIIVFTMDGKSKIHLMKNDGKLFLGLRQVKLTQGAKIRKPLNKLQHQVEK